MTLQEAKTGFILRRRLTFAFLLLAVLPLVVSALLISWTSSQETLSSAHQLQQENATRIAERSLAGFHELSREVNGLLRLQSVMALGQDQQQELIEELLADRGTYRQIWLLNTTGMVLACASNSVLGCPEVEPAEWQGRQSYSAALKRARVSYEPVRFQEDTGMPWQRIGFPVVALANGMVEGVLVVEVNLRFLWPLTLPQSRHSSMRHYILDATRRLISHPNPSLVLQGKVFSPISGRMLQPGLDGNEALLTTASFRLEDLEFMVVVERDRVEVFRDIYGHLVEKAVALLVVLLTTIAFGQLIKFYVFQPLQQMQATIGDLLAGNYTARLPLAPSLEFAEHACAFNQMAHTLTQSIASLEKEVQVREQAERTAKESHERLKTILDSIDSIVYVADMETYELLFVNKHVRDLFGDIEGNICWQALQSGQPGPCPFCTNDKLVDAEGQPTAPYRWEFQNTIVNRWYFIADRALTWMDGRIVRLEIATDITERKQAELDVVRAKEEWQKTFDAITMPIMILDLEFRIVRANKAMAEALGVSSSVVPGMTCYKAVHGANQPSQDCPHLALLADRSRHQAEIYAEHLGGWYKVSVDPLCGVDGQLIGSVHCAEDITERRKMDEQLRESEKQLKEAQRIAQVGSWELDLVRNTLLCSEEVYRIFELGPQHFSASYEVFLKVSHPEDRVAVEAAYTNSVQNKAPYAIEHRLLFADGRIKHVRQHAETYYAADGAPLRTVGTVQDITEQKRREGEIRELNLGLEKRVSERTRDLYENQRALTNIVDDLNEKTIALEQANLKLQDLDRLKSMFIASMSHELRTPLNSIIGFSGIVKAEWLGPLNEEQKAKLAIVLRTGQHLLSLINDLIDISKIEAGKLECNPDTFDLYDLITEAAGIIETELAAKGITLQVEALHLSMRSDRRRLYQCLVNLLGNAVKFSRQGVITLKVALTGGRDCWGVEMVSIAVKDTGIGIKEEDLPRLFAAFVRLPLPVDMQIKGTGLGLYLVKKIVTDLLGGEVSATSVHGQGSEFILTVPVRIEQGNQHGEAA